MPANKEFELLIKSKPWISEKCIAKIIVETAFNWMEEPIKNHFSEIKNSFTSFIKDTSEHKENSGRSLGFNFSDNFDYGKKHLVEIKFAPHQFFSKVVLFGTAAWTYEFIHPSFNKIDYQGVIRLSNPLIKSEQPTIEFNL